MGLHGSTVDPGISPQLYVTEVDLHGSGISVELNGSGVDLHGSGVDLGISPSVTRILWIWGAYPWIWDGSRKGWFSMDLG